MTTPRILIIAGSDSSGGAGIQADIKTVTMLGGHAMTAITAVTAQNTRGVSGVHPIPAQMVLDQIAACVDDIGVDAVKIGMIGSAETAMAVAERLKTLLSSPQRKLGSRAKKRDAGDPSFRWDDEIGEKGVTIPIVLDPVMVATSGAVLADEATIAAFGALMDVATLTTPNLPELDALGGEAAVLAHGTALLMKGGHGGGNEITDRLVDTDGRETCWTEPRIDTPHDHGTGCTLASAIAMGLAEGRALPEAIARARAFVRAALRAAPDFVAENGPMGHQTVRVDQL
ncbi:bifunctional hydroxymethylpyrimidine kinase/phosphomethylpyrimidine kinase [Novosphingopyxis sp.]|uniref:bifunctional hydroxymethylpyrimidine kinase/phosphomethylpyrimidine kinase n=1 Tax=Novosphingopyxis sp. TaxID=2709690 RepID=UPI003B5AFF06